MPWMHGLSCRRCVSEVAAAWPCSSAGPWPCAITTTGRGGASTIRRCGARTTPSRGLAQGAAGSMWNLTRLAKEHPHLRSHWKWKDLLGEDHGKDAWGALCQGPESASNGELSFGSVKRLGSRQMQRSSPKLALLAKTQRMWCGSWWMLRVEVRRRQSACLMFGSSPCMSRWRSMAWCTSSENLVSLRARQGRHSDRKHVPVLSLQVY